jgi:uncharacterized phage-associated protein
MLTKNQILLAYLTKYKEKASVTVLMKLAYLVDLVSIKKGSEKIFSFVYKRYTYGPFDESIYRELEALQLEGVVLPKSDFTATGEEYIYYSFNTESEIDCEDISETEKTIINEVLESVKGFGAKILTDIAYKTKPMQMLGATLGGNEHLNEQLDLAA